MAITAYNIKPFCSQWCQAKQQALTDVLGCPVQIWSDGHAGIIMLAILCIGYPCAVLRNSSMARKVIKVSQAIAASCLSSAC